MVRSRPLLSSVVLATALLVASCGGDAASPVLSKPRVVINTPTVAAEPAEPPVPGPGSGAESVESYQPEETVAPTATTPPVEVDDSRAFATALVGTWSSGCAAGDDEAPVCQRLELGADGTYSWEESSDNQHFAYAGSWSVVAVGEDRGQLVLSGASIAAAEVSDDQLEIFGDALEREGPIVGTQPDLAVIPLPDVGSAIVGQDLRAMAIDSIVPASVERIMLRADGTYTAVVDDSCSSTGIWGLRVEVEDNERSGPTTRRLVLNDLHLCGGDLPDVDASVADPAAVRATLHAQVDVDVIDGRVFLADAGYEDIREDSGTYAGVLPFRSGTGPSGWFSFDVPMTPGEPVRIQLRLVNVDRREQEIERLRVTVGDDVELIPLGLLLDSGAGLSTTVTVTFPRGDIQGEPLAVGLEVVADTGNADAGFTLRTGA